jgi:hypothetical protein
LFLDRLVLNLISRRAGEVNLSRSRIRDGVPAGRDGERIAEHLRGTLRSDDEHLAAFKTLLRLGRGDLLADEPDAQSQYRSDDYKLWRSTISPSSPSEVCTDQRKSGFGPMAVIGT